MKRVVTENGATYKILTGADICGTEAGPMSEKTAKYIDDLMAIDAECYGGDEKGEDCCYVGDATGYYDRFGFVEGEDGKWSLDPNRGCVDNIIAVANDEGRIVGYINYLTMGEELHNEIVNPDIEAYLEDPTRRDDGITGDQLKKWSKDEPNDLFILSVTIAKDYQDGDVVKLVSNEFREELIRKEEEGYHINSITADTVSDHGEDFTKMLRCDNAKGKDGKPIILPCPESDESGHPVTVRICEGENLEALLSQGFDFEREKLAVSKSSERSKSIEGLSTFEEEGDQTQVGG